MQVLKRDGFLWSYLSDNQKGLVQDGEMLLTNIEDFRKGEISDFSFLVFPFAKAFEGFLKKFLLDLGLIREDDYYSDEIRIGRILNPGYMEHNASVYKMLCSHQKGGQGLSDDLWDVWKKARNQVFHYFPHNFRKLEYDEALDLIKRIVDVMELTMTDCEISTKTQD